MRELARHAEVIKRFELEPIARQALHALGDDTFERLEQLAALTREIEVAQLDFWLHQSIEEF